MLGVVGEHEAGAVTRITVYDFVVGDRAESKMWSHGVSRDQLFAMLENRLVIVENRKNRAAKHVVIGRDNNVRCVAAPVLPTDNPTVWRPITAWPCKPGEAAKLR